MELYGAFESALETFLLIVFFIIFWYSLQHFCFLGGFVIGIRAL
jgi:hypothetical protein